MSYAPGGLTELMDTLRRAGGSWDVPQVLELDAAALAAAWCASDDPVAMLFLLAALHPGHQVKACDALVACLSSWPPMAHLAEQQARARPGMNYNGPDLFRLLALAQRARGGRAREPLTPEQARRLSDAIREVAPDPRSIPQPR